MTKMETMERKKPRPRRSFTPEFKAEIVERCLSGDRSIGQVARDFDLTETAVRKWVEQARIDAGEIDGWTTEERQELEGFKNAKRRRFCGCVQQGWRVPGQGDGLPGASGRARDRERSSW